MLNKIKNLLTIIPLISLLTLQGLYAQTESFTYSEIITELNSKDCNQNAKNKAEVNSFLLKEIQKRKIKTILNSEIEALLIEAGANDALIKTIKTSFQPEGKNDAEYYFNSANQYFQKKDFDRAIIEYSKAIQLNKNHVLAYFHRGQAYAEKGDKAKAFQDYTEAISNHKYIDDRNDYYDYLEQFHLKRAEIQTDHALAVVDYTKVINLNSKNIDAYIERGYSYYFDGDDASALKDFNQAVKLAPNNVNAYISRAEFFYKTADWNEAIADWRKILEIDPNNELAKGNLDSRLEDEENELIYKLSPDEEETGKMSLLTLENALKLESYLLPSEKRKQIMLKYIKERKVDFTLTSDIEKNLRKFNADDEIIKAIRESK